MTLRFFLDEDISARIAEGLRREGIDALSVHEVHRNGLADEEQLAFAAADGRVLVTYNRADYEVLDAQWRLAGRMHRGILWCSERSIRRQAVGDLVRAIEAMDCGHESLDGLCLPLVRQAR